VEKTVFNKYRQQQFAIYNAARATFISSPNKLIELEKYITEEVENVIKLNLPSIVKEYNEASYLYPFWQNYPPEERGRAPKGDQFPWIEVGEHTIGIKLSRILTSNFTVEDYGLPTGADQRLLLRNQKIEQLLGIKNSSAWLFTDIKSVGPRDDADHTVMSHNQISGDGEWLDQNQGVINKVLTAQGARANHPFHCSIPPLYILSDGTVAPMINVVVKVVYDMLNLTKGRTGQPLKRITLATIPNGLLLTMNPNYIKTYPGILFPGKDDKDKSPTKVRARISFDILRKIDSWRVKDINI
jgi:hypothetical protein